MTFEEKQMELRNMVAALQTKLREHFPVNEAISWRTENSFTQHGNVTGYDGDRVRVLDGTYSFYQTITVTDILRAN